MSLNTLKSIVITLLFILSGCLVTQAVQPVEALLEKSSVQNRLILEKEIGNLLGSQPIKLADDVFTAKSTVVIESKQPKDRQGRLMDGREMRQANTFSLLTEHGKCYLKHDQSDQISMLSDISCKVK